MRFSSSLSNAVTDPIYGIIHLSDEEVSVVATPLFRRLHQIRQNGLLYYIFPSATHSRFEHSLGVVHVADSMLKALLVNSAYAARKASPSVRPADRAESGQAIDLSAFDDDTIDFLFRITRLAALAHDLGHGPFSHTFDAFAPQIDFIMDLIREAPELIALRELPKQFEEEEDPTLWDEPRRIRVEHEHMSCVFFAYIWNKLGYPPEVATDVAAVILGKPKLCDNAEHRVWLPLMHDIVASAPADADRMDYLERDSRSMGVTYGLFDRNRVLKSILPYATGAGRDRVYRLGFKASGLRAVENLIQARFQMFVQVYYHKTNQALQHMLDAIANIADSEGISLFNWESMDDLVDVYQELGDERFLRILRGKDREFGVTNGRICQIARDIFERRLWKRVYEGEFATADAVIERLRSQFPEAVMKVYRVKPDAVKHLDEGAALLRRDGDSVYVATDRPHSWNDASTIINALAENESALGRIYLQDNDDALVKELRNAAHPHGLR